MSDSAIAIKFDHLRVEFGGNLLAIDDFSLSIAKGEFVSIVGPSGCGKTTVLNLLTGLLPLEQGRIEILGKKPVAGNLDIAYMLARDSLLPWRTTLGNATFGTGIRKINKPKRDARALELLHQVGLAGFEWFECQRLLLWVVKLVFLLVVLLEAAVLLLPYQALQHLVQYYPLRLVQVFQFLRRGVY